MLQINRQKFLLYPYLQPSFVTKVMLEYYFKEVTDKSGQADRINTDFSVQMLEQEITPFF